RSMRPPAIWAGLLRRERTRCRWSTPPARSTPSPPPTRPSPGRSPAPAIAPPTPSTPARTRAPSTWTTSSPAACACRSRCPTAAAPPPPRSPRWSDRRWAGRTRGRRMSSPATCACAMPRPPPRTPPTTPPPAPATTPSSPANRGQTPSGGAALEHRLRLGERTVRGVPGRVGDRRRRDVGDRDVLHGAERAATGAGARSQDAGGQRHLRARVGQHRRRPVRARAVGGHEAVAPQLQRAGGEAPDRERVVARPRRVGDRDRRRRRDRGRQKRLAPLGRDLVTVLGDAGRVHRPDARAAGRVVLV